MIRRREAKEICRTTKVDQCAGTNEYVDRIRATPAAAETCFVIDTDALPVEAAAVIAEKTALVVRVPESWLDNVDMLGRDYDLRPFFRSGGNQVSSGATGYGPGILVPIRAALACCVRLSPFYSGRVPV